MPLNVCSHFNFSANGSLLAISNHQGGVISSLGELILPSWFLSYLILGHLFFQDLYSPLQGFQRSPGQEKVLNVDVLSPAGFANKIVNPLTVQCFAQGCLVSHVSLCECVRPPHIYLLICYINFLQRMRSGAMPHVKKD